MVVSDLAGGSPPASGSLPAAPTLHDVPHPAGTASLGGHSRPASPQPIGLAQQQKPQFSAPQQHAHDPTDSDEAMQVDRALLSRSQSPALSGGMGVAALRTQPPSDQQASAFVPLSEVGGSGASSHVHEAAVVQQHPEEQHPQQQQQHAHPHHSGRPPLDPHLPLPPREARMHDAHPAAQPSAHEQHSQPSGSSLGEPSSRPDRPPSGAGYESGDDMDMLAMQHCTNCTGTLWGHICMVSTAGGGAVLVLGLGLVSAWRGPRLRCIGSCGVVLAVCSVFHSLILIWPVHSLPSRSYASVCVILLVFCRTAATCRHTTPTSSSPRWLRPALCTDRACRCVGCPTARVCLVCRLLLYALHLSARGRLWAADQMRFQHRPSRAPTEAPCR